jgi:hypothetical protein
MDIVAFEKRLFEILEKESLILTPVNVGFALDIDASDAIGMMNALVESNKLELVSGSGTAAVYRRTGHATYEATPGATSVGAAKSSECLYHLLLNVFIPGLGSLIYKRFGFWAIIFVLFGISVAILVLAPSLGKLFSILGFAIWYLVSLLGSIFYYLKDPWGTGKQK